LRPFSRLESESGGRRIQHPVAWPAIRGNIPVERCHAWSDRRRFIADTPAVGLASAAVKLRQLIHPELGIGDGHPDDVAARPRRSRRDRAHDRDGLTT